MLENKSYIKSSADKELGHADVVITNLGMPSVHRVILVQRTDGSLYTVWNSVTEGTAFTNYSNEKYLEVYSQLQKRLAEYLDPTFSYLSADQLRDLDAIFVLDKKPRIYNSLVELNDDTVSEVKLSFKDY